MIKSVTITNYIGKHLTIVLGEAEPKSGLLITNITGLGPANANINMSPIATGDGSEYNSARLETRNIVISLRFMFAKTIEDVRQLTYEYFPIKKKLTFYIETENRIVETVGYVENNEPDIFSKDESSQISIICPDPFFYSAGENGIHKMLFSGTESLFEFPFENNSLTEPLLEFGNSYSLTERNIFYEGDIDVGIVIKIHAIGEVGDLFIYNLNTREQMAITAEKMIADTGQAIVAGDEIVINTNRGSKGITLLRNGVYKNILNVLGKDADWFTLRTGDNLFAYMATSGLENLEFEIEYRLLYEGV